MPSPPDATTTTRRRRRVDRRLVPLALIFVVVGVSTATMVPFLALFLTDAVHATGAQVAAFVSAAPISTVVVTTLVARRSDRLRTRQGLLIATALLGCANAAITALVRDYWTLLVVAITLGAGAGALMPQVFAYARESLRDADRVALTMSSLRSLFSTAWVAGPPLAAALLHLGGFRLVYGASSAMYAVAAVVSLVALDQPRPATSGVQGDDQHHRANAPRDADADAPRVVVRMTVVAFVLARCAGTLAVQALPLLTTRVIGGGVQDAGWLLGLCAAVEIPLMVGFGLLSARFPLARLIQVGLACAFAYLTLASLSTATWQLAVGQVLNAAFVATVSGLGITYVQDLLPRRPGRASTVFSNTSAAGSVLAGPILGAARAFGYRMPYAVSAVLVAAALALVAASGRSVETRHAV